MTTYSIAAPRSAAILYLAWEYGISGARQIADALPMVRNGWLEMTACPLFTDTRRSRAQADRYAERIRNAIAYQEGRLGRHMTAGGGTVAVTTSCPLGGTDAVAA